MRVILDTNVLVRTAKPHSPARELLALIKAGPHLLVASPFLLRELERVMIYDRVRAARSVADLREHRDRVDLLTASPPLQEERWCRLRRVTIAGCNFTTR